MIKKNFRVYLERAHLALLTTIVVLVFKKKDHLQKQNQNFFAILGDQEGTDHGADGLIVLFRQLVKLPHLFSDN